MMSALCFSVLKPDLIGPHLQPMTITFPVLTSQPNTPIRESLPISGQTTQTFFRATLRPFSQVKDEVVVDEVEEDLALSNSSSRSVASLVTQRAGVLIDLTTPSQATSTMMEDRTTATVPTPSTTIHQPWQPCFHQVTKPETKLGTLSPEPPAMSQAI